MQSGFKWALGIILLIVFLLGLLVFVLPSFVKPDFVKQFLTETVEKHTGFLLALDQPEFSIFPIPSFQFKNVKVRNKTDSSTTPAFLTADQIQCELRVFPLLFKQVEFAKVKFSGMTVKLALPTEGRFFHLREINLTLENVRSNDWIKFSLEGKWLGEEPNLFIKGKAKANFNPWSWNQTILNADLDLRNVSAGKLLEWLGLSWSGQVKEGVVSVTAGLSKLENTSALSATTKLILDQLVYYLTLDPTNTSKPVRYDLGVDASVDFDTQVLSLTNIQLVTPFATVQGKGGVDLVNQKLEGVQLNADAILLDDLPKYFLTLARVLPLNLGFSGEAKADLLLQ
ncbi:MAG: AsmA family protein, partial [Candidatus Omnitrophica bacterium]|nr:AsmA family protein [Candidatus Omnitrophota bacterium]